MQWGCRRWFFSFFEFYEDEVVSLVMVILNDQCYGRVFLLEIVVVAGRGFMFVVVFVGLVVKYNLQVFFAVFLQIIFGFGSRLFDLDLDIYVIGVVRILEINFMVFVLGFIVLFCYWFFYLGFYFLVFVYYVYWLFFVMLFIGRIWEKMGCILFFKGFRCVIVLGWGFFFVRFTRRLQFQEEIEVRQERIQGCFFF